jgi:hypothetical protein
MMLPPGICSVGKKKRPGCQPGRMKHHGEFSL